jgi:hypothetical protein
MFLRTPELSLRTGAANTRTICRQTKPSPFCRLLQQKTIKVGKCLRTKATRDPCTCTNLRPLNFVASSLLCAPQGKSLLCGQCQERGTAGQDRKRRLQGPSTFAWLRLGPSKTAREEQPLLRPECSTLHSLVVYTDSLLPSPDQQAAQAGLRE